MKFYWLDHRAITVLRLLVVLVAVAYVVILLKGGLFNALWPPLRIPLATAVAVGAMILILPRRIRSMMAALGLVLITIPIALFEASREAEYVDLSLGRAKHEYAFFGLVYRSELRSSELSDLYKQLGGELPAPHWLIDWRTTRTAHSDWFTHDMIGISRNLYFRYLESSSAPSDVKRQVIEAFAEVKPFLNVPRRYVVDCKQGYFYELAHYLEEYDAGKTTALSIPSAEECVKRWLDEHSDGH